jgi:hypothetical protein
MSGGSGSRVNGYTISYIKKQQEELESNVKDLAATASDQEMEDDGMQDDEQDEMQYEEQGEIDPFDKLDSLEEQEGSVIQDSPLKSVPLMDEREEDDYAKMPEGSIINTKIFGIKTSEKIFNPQHEDETHRVLERAFSPGFTGDLPQLRAIIADKSNFEVCEVVRLRNKCTKGMHEQFKKSFKIKQTVLSYHGTAHADLISEVGFRGAASQRAKFGKGIYSSPNVYHALSYATPTKEGYLEFLVVELHLGPMALGRPDQVSPYVFLYYSERFLTRSSRRWTSERTRRENRS